MDEDLRDRLLEKVEKDDSGCWIWQGYRRGSDYGGLWHDGKSRYVHRLSYQVFIGEIPADGFIHHTCGTRLCLNPEHLQCTTWEQNYAEMTARQSLLARIKELEDEVELLRKGHGTV